VNLDVVGQTGHLLVKPVPAGDLERDQADLPQPLRRGQRALDPAHLQHVDAAAPERDRPSHRDRMHQPAVEVVLAVHLDRRQQPRHRARGQHGRRQWAAGEPARAGPLDAGRHAVERQPEFGERAHRQPALQHRPQRPERVQVGAGPGQRGGPAQQVPAERLLQAGPLPEPGQPLRGRGRVGGHERPVDRPHRGAHDHVRRDASLRQCPQHAHLVRAEHPAATQHERRLHRPFPPRLAIAHASDFFMPYELAPSGFAHPPGSRRRYQER
jgi:hypothetical protein